MVKRRILAAAVVCCLQLACNDRATQSVSSGAVVRDSAGIAIVENPEHAPDTFGLAIDTMPRVAIGEELRGPAYMFGTVVGLERFSDGRIIVAEGRAVGLGIRVFDTLGTYLHDIGRRGPGPGEYTSIRKLFMLPGDTLVAASVYDEGPLIYYDARGRHVRTVVRTAFPADPGIGRYGTTSVHGLLRDGTLLVTQGWQPGWASAPGRSDLALEQPHVFVDTARLVRAVPDSVPLAVYGIVPRERGVFYPRARPQSGFHSQSIFAQPSFAIRRMNVLVAEGQAFEIREYAPDGQLVRIIRKRHTPVPVTRAWADSVERAARGLAERSPSLRWLLETPMPEPPPAAPAIDRLIVDEVGNLWVYSNYPRRSPAEPIWYVFGPDGVLTHSLRANIPQVARIGRDHVLAAVRDSLDVPQVVVFPIVRR